MNTSEHEPTFYMRIAKGDGYEEHGPIPLSRIRSWSEEGSIAPGTKFSRERMVWDLTLDDVLNYKPPANVSSPDVESASGGSPLSSFIRVCFLASAGFTVLVYFMARRSNPSEGMVIFYTIAKFVAGATLLWLIIYTAVREAMLVLRRRDT